MPQQYIAVSQQYIELSRIILKNCDDSSIYANNIIISIGVVKITILSWYINYQVVIITLFSRLIVHFIETLKIHVV